MRTSVAAAAVLLLAAGTGVADVPPVGGGTPTPHPPILIDGDGDVCEPFSGVVNCGTATGTCASPYRIAGWSVASSESLGLPAVTILRTTVCIVVEGNSLATPADVGLATVRLESVRDVTVTGNDIAAGTATGIVVQDSSNVALVSNTVTAAGAAGAIDLVRVTNTPAFAVTSNVFTALSAARAHVQDVLDVSSSPGARFTANDYSSANAVAVRLTGSPNTTFANDRARELFGVYAIASSAGVTVTGLDASLVSAGIQAVNSGAMTMRSSAVGDDFPCEPACWLPPIGMSLTSTSLTMRDTALRNFTIGLDAGHPGDWMDLRCITLTGNDVGIRVNDLGSSYVDASAFVGNAIAIENLGTSTYQAKNNWWGTPAGPTASDLVGKVHANPWLTSPPACAPPA